MNCRLYGLCNPFPFCKVAAAMFALATLAGCGVQPEAPSATAISESKPDIYSVAEYDPARDPAADLAVTVKTASVEEKNIILVVGGNWCSWCRLLADYIHTNEGVHEKLASNFVLMKVNTGDGNDNTEFLGQYPKAEGYPHLYVLNSKGEFVHSQGTGVLEDGAGYDDAKFLAFLEEFSP